jgi:transketolase
MFIVKRNFASTGKSWNEAGATLCWYKWVGRTGDVIGLDHFGASAPGEVVMDKLGFNVENVVQRALQLLHREKAPATAAA